MQQCCALCVGLNPEFRFQVVFPVFCNVKLFPPETLCVSFVGHTLCLVHASWCQRQRDLQCVTPSHYLLQMRRPEKCTALLNPRGLHPNSIVLFSLWTSRPQRFSPKRNRPTGQGTILAFLSLSPSNCGANCQEAFALLPVSLSLCLFLSLPSLPLSLSLCLFLSLPLSLCLTVHSLHPFCAGAALWTWGDFPGW